MTVDGYTFTLASDAKGNQIYKKDNKIEDVKLGDLYMKNIRIRCGARYG